MKNKKATNLTMNKLIIIILVILVILAILMFVFKVDILEWLRNLPGYSYNETDKEIDLTKLSDAQVAELCPEGSLVGFIGNFEGTIGFREQYIHLFVRGKTYTPTKFYWRGSETNGKIWFLKKDKYLGWDWFNTDLEVAEVKERLISVKPELLDLNSEIYQKTRFSKDRPVELKYVNRLDNSYTVSNNKICRIAEETKFKPAWPESEGKEIIELDPKLRVNDQKLEIQGLWDYVSVFSTGVEFLYLVNEDGHIRVNGYKKGWWNDYENIFEIYPDGSIWFTNRYKGGTVHGGTNVYELIELNDKREVKEPPLDKRINPYIFKEGTVGEMLETNLRLPEKWNYDKIRNFVETLK